MLAAAPHYVVTETKCLGICDQSLQSLHVPQPQLTCRCSGLPCRGDTPCAPCSLLPSLPPLECAGPTEGLEHKPLPLCHCMGLDYRVLRSQALSAHGHAHPSHSLSWKSAGFPVGRAACQQCCCCGACVCVYTLMHTCILLMTSLKGDRQGEESWVIQHPFPASDHPKQLGFFTSWVCFAWLGKFLFVFSSFALKSNLSSASSETLSHAMWWSAVVHLRVYFMEGKCPHLGPFA